MGFRVTGVSPFPRYGFSPNGGMVFPRYGFSRNGGMAFPAIWVFAKVHHSALLFSFSLAAPPHGIFCMVFAPPHGLCFSRPNCRVHYVVSVSRNAPHMALSQRDARFILAFNAKNTRVLYVYRGALHYAACCSRSEKYTRAFTPGSYDKPPYKRSDIFACMAAERRAIRHKTHRPIGITGMRSRLENGRTGMQDKTRGIARF